MGPGVSGSQDEKHLSSIFKQHDNKDGRCRQSRTASSQVCQSRGQSQDKLV